MAKPTTRKEWLEKFFELFETNSRARLFRTQLGIPLSHVPAHVTPERLAAYKEELRVLTETEKPKPKKAKKTKNSDTSFDFGANIVPASG